MELDDSINSRKPPQTIMYSKITPLGLKARSIKYRTTPVTSGEYNAGNNTIRFNLSSSTAFLDPHLTYLKFSVQNKTVTLAGPVAQDIQFDGSAHSLIKRLRITSKSGGFDLENINEYGNLYNLLADLQLDSHYRMGAGAICEGFGADNGYANPSIAETVLAGDANLAGNNGATKYFCLPIMSSIIGQLNNKYLPLFLTGDVQLEIELHARPMVNIIGAGAVLYSVGNVELHTQLIEFSSEVNNTLRAIASTSGLYIHSTSWKNFPAQLQASQDNSLIINERLRSVKSLLFDFRGPIPANAQLRPFGRSSNALSSYQLKIGQTLYPTQAIRAGIVGDASEFYAETLKAVGCYANSHNAGVITPTNYATSVLATVQAVGTPGRAVYGLDLDAFTKQNIESGVNSILDNPFTLMISTSANCVALNADMYILHDQIIVLQPDGQLLVSR